MAHYGRYDRDAAAVAFGDTLEATARAAAERYPCIDKNVLSSLDYVAVCQHSSDLHTKLGGMLTHRWTGPVWGEGVLVADPTPALGVGKRPWSDPSGRVPDLARVTDQTGTRRIRPAVEHAEDGVRRSVIQVFEVKASPLLEVPLFWDRFGRQLDAVGHPRIAMTLSNIGSPLRRIKAAHSVTPPFQVAVLPRGEKRPDLIAEADAVWGTAWQ